MKKLTKTKIFKKVFCVRIKQKKKNLQILYFNGKKTNFFFIYFSSINFKISAHYFWQKWWEASGGKSWLYKLNCCWNNIRSNDRKVFCSFFSAYSAVKLLTYRSRKHRFLYSSPPTQRIHSASSSPYVYNSRKTGKMNGKQPQ